jgi:cold shock CspA family protein
MGWGGKGKMGSWQMQMLMAMMKGKGKGKGKGGGGSGWKKAPKTIKKEDAESISTDTTYTGVVDKYNKFKGYGWIKMDQAGVVPDDTLFVYYKSIESDDRFPQLLAGMKVQFAIHKYKSQNGTAVRAKRCALPGGGSVAIQDKEDAEKKTFVGGQNLRYTGELKFYRSKQGYGYVKMDAGFKTDEAVPEEIRVEEAEMNCGGKKPFGLKDIKVEFGIWKTKKGAFKAYNMTLPKGVPISKEAIENRKITSPTLFKGTIVRNMWKKGFGYIECAAGQKIPANVTTKMKSMKTETEAKGKKVTEGDVLYFRTADIEENKWLKKDQEVQFKIYMDDKGVGACEIH